MEIGDNDRICSVALLRKRKSRTSMVTTEGRGCNNIVIVYYGAMI